MNRCGQHSNANRFFGHINLKASRMVEQSSTTLTFLVSLSLYECSSNLVQVYCHNHDLSPRIRMFASWRMSSRIEDGFPPFYFLPKYLTCISSRALMNSSYSIVKTWGLMPSHFIQFGYIFGIHFFNNWQ